MFALQRSDGKFLCYHDQVYAGGFRKQDECVNLWINIYPAYLNKRRDQLRKIYSKFKIKVVRLTPKQLEDFTFIKLRGIK